MKDRIFTKLIALVLLLAIAGGSAFAQQKKLGFQGRPSNLHEQNQYNMIDYDLIKNDLGARKVTVTLIPSPLLCSKRNTSPEPCG